MKELLKIVKFDDKGLVTAVAQDAKTKEVLMVAFMNKEALAKTLKTGLMHYYSRSRKKLWLKGEQSGHIQKVKAVFVDCDGDCLLFAVQQAGAACHAGFRNCFYRKADLKKGKWKVTGKQVFDPAKVYQKKG